MIKTNYKELNSKIDIIHCIQYNEFSNLLQLVQKCNLSRWVAKKSFSLGGRRYDYHNITVKAGETILDVILNNKINKIKNNENKDLIEILKILVNQGTKTQYLCKIKEILISYYYDKIDTELYSVFTPLDKALFFDVKYNHYLLNIVNADNYTKIIKIMTENDMKIDYFKIKDLLWSIICNEKRNNKTVNITNIADKILSDFPSEKGKFLYSCFYVLPDDYVEKHIKEIEYNQDNKAEYLIKNLVDKKYYLSLDALLKFLGKVNIVNKIHTKDLNVIAILDKYGIKHDDVYWDKGDSINNGFGDYEDF